MADDEKASCAPHEEQHSPVVATTSRPFRIFIGFFLRSHFLFKSKMVSGDDENVASALNKSEGQEMKEKESQTPPE